MEQPPGLLDLGFGPITRIMLFLDVRDLATAAQVPALTSHECRNALCPPHLSPLLTPPNPCGAGLQAVKGDRCGEFPRSARRPSLSLPFSLAPRLPRQVAKRPTCAMHTVAVRRAIAAIPACMLRLLLQRKPTLSGSARPQSCTRRRPGCWRATARGGCAGLPLPQRSC